VPEILKFLAIKRSVECNRMEFFAYAEAFASLVKMECIGITGAIATIIHMLGSAETRSAAITMLGKTVELCLPLLQESCDASTLSELRLALQGVRNSSSIERQRRLVAHSFTCAADLGAMLQLRYQVCQWQHELGRRDGRSRAHAILEPASRSDVGRYQLVHRTYEPDIRVQLRSDSR